MDKFFVHQSLTNIYFILLFLSLYRFLLKVLWYTSTSTQVLSIKWIVGNVLSDDVYASVVHSQDIYRGIHTKCAVFEFLVFAGLSNDKFTITVELDWTQARINAQRLQ